MRTLLSIDVSYSELIKWLKWIMFTFYLIIAILSFTQWFRLQFRSNGKRKSSKPKWLYFLVFLFSLVRATWGGIPAPVFYRKIQPYAIIQICMDLLPELLVFSTYFLLLLIWAELYHFSKKMKDSNLLTRRLWIIYFVGNAIVYITGLCLAIGFGYKQKYTKRDLMIEAIFLAILSTALAIAYPIYGGLLFRTLERVAISSNRKRAMVVKLAKLLATCIVCFVLHTTYILLLDVKLRNLKASPYWFAFTWFFYFLITEQIPAVLILYLTGKVTMPNPRKSRALNPVKAPLLSDYQHHNPTPSSSDLGSLLPPSTSFDHPQPLSSFYSSSPTFVADPSPPNNSNQHKSVPSIHSHSNQRGSGNLVVP